ncbi:MAG: DUF4411 family protein [Anaerolineae bacterium]|nr:DUF4411 family protein [Anaerolineae bacterium]
MRNDIICFDTQILIWGIKQEATSGQEEKIARAIHLLKMCQEEKSKVIIPAIVAAELLSGTPEDRHNKITQTLQSYFMIIPFDMAAAQSYAHIWRQNEALRRKLSSEEEVDRVKAKADHLIIATAVARKATVIYSEDKDLKRFAERFINVRVMPPVPPAQLDLL